MGVRRDLESHGSNQREKVYMLDHPKSIEFFNTASPIQKSVSNEKVLWPIHFFREQLPTLAMFFLNFQLFPILLWRTWPIYAIYYSNKDILDKDILETSYK